MGLDEFGDSGLIANNDLAIEAEVCNLCPDSWDPTMLGLGFWV